MTALLAAPIDVATAARQPWEHAADCPGWRMAWNGSWSCPCPRNDEPEGVQFTNGYRPGDGMPKDLDRDPDLPTAWEAS
jgi:hypothetical protein